MKEKNKFAQGLGRLGGMASVKKRWSGKTPEEIKEAMREMRKLRRPHITLDDILKDTNGTPDASDTNGSEHSVV